MRTLFERLPSFALALLVLGVGLTACTQGSVVIGSGAGEAQKQSHQQMVELKSYVKNLSTALEMYTADHKGLYPQSCDELIPSYLKRLPMPVLTVKSDYVSKKLEPLQAGSAEYTQLAGGKGYAFRIGGPNGQTLADPAHPAEAWVYTNETPTGELDKVWDSLIGQ